MRRWAQITSDYWLPQVGEGEADTTMRGRGVHRPATESKLSSAMSRVLIRSPETHRRAVWLRRRRRKVEQHTGQHDGRGDVRGSQTGNRGLACAHVTAVSPEHL